MIHPIAKNQFKPGGVGTLVTNPTDYLDALHKEVAGFTFPAEGDNAGQGFVPMPDSVKGFVVPGAAKRNLLSEKTGIIRNHRGEDILCVDRSKVDVGEADSVAAIVYTMQAFLNDPENGLSSEEKTQLLNGEFTHVLVTTLAFKGPKSPLTPHRFMHNVAGGNAAYASTNPHIVERAKEAVTKSENDTAFSEIQNTAAWDFCKWAGHQDIDEGIRKEAQEVMEYWAHWALVG